MGWIQLTEYRWVYLALSESLFGSLRWLRVINAPPCYLTCALELLNMT